MATSGIINGTNMCIYINSVKVAVLTGTSLTLSWPTRETANKDSGSWMTKIPTRGNWSIAGSAFFQFLTTAEGGYLKLFTAMTAKSQVYVQISDNTSGDYHYHGFGYITDLGADFPDDEASTYNITVEGNGQLYFTAIT